MIFAETSTLGLRIHAAERRVEERRMVEVETALGQGPRKGFRTAECSRRNTKIAARSRSAPGRRCRRCWPRRMLAYLKQDEMKYYLTTPIYYTNAAPHIGHAYTTIAADTIRRLKQMQGFDAVLATGTDEHGVNVERAGAGAGKIAAGIYRCDLGGVSQAMGDPGAGHRPLRAHHQRPARQGACRICSCAASERGYVYKGHYTGQYCIFDKLYINDAKPGDPCPECGRPTETVTEENYYFKLSAFQDRLLDLYESQPDFIQPETRRNEVIAFVRQGLKDLSISRTTIKWGIPVPGRTTKHVFYVWFDALSTYMSAVDGEESVAGGSAPDRQGNRALSRGVLAGVSVGRRVCRFPSGFSRTAGCCLKTTR